MTAIQKLCIKALFQVTVFICPCALALATLFQYDLFEVDEKMKQIVVESIEKTKKGWKKGAQLKLKQEYPELYKELVFLEEQINSKMIEGAREDEIKLLIERWEELLEKIKRMLND